MRTIYFCVPGLLAALLAAPAMALQEWELVIPTTFPFDQEEHGTARKGLSPAAVRAGILVEYDTALSGSRAEIQVALDAYNAVRNSNIQFNLAAAASPAWNQGHAPGQLWGNPSGWGTAGPTLRIIIQDCTPGCSALPNGTTGAFPATPGPLGATGAIWVWDPAAGHWCYPNKLSTTTSLPSYAVLVLRESNYTSRLPSSEVIAHEIGHALGFEEQRLRTSAAFSVLESPTAVPNVYRDNSPAYRGGVFRLGAYAQGFLRKYYPAQLLMLSPRDEWQVHDEVLRRDPTQPLDAPSRVVALSIFQVPEIAPRFLIWSSSTSRYVECQTREIPRFYAQVSETSARATSCTASVALEHVIDGTSDVVVASESITNPCDTAFHEYQYKTYAFFGASDVIAAGYANPPTATGAPLSIDFEIRVNAANAAAEARSTNNAVRFTGSTALMLFPEDTTDPRCKSERASAAVPTAGARLGRSLATNKRAPDSTQYTVAGMPNLDAGGANRVGAVLLTAYRAGTGEVLAGYPVQVGAPSAAGDEEFGAALAISSAGDTLVIGAPGLSGNDGGVYVCTRSGTTVSCPAPIVPSAGGAGRFGSAVAMTPDAKIIAIGEPESAGGGRVHLYFWNGTAYVLDFWFSELNAVDYGAALAANQDWLVVGDPERAGGGYAKAFRLTYDPATGVYIPVSIDLGAQVSRAAGDELGYAVSVHDNVLVVGAPGTHDDTGVAYVFGQPHGDMSASVVGYNYVDDWRWVQTLTTSNAGARFGTSVDNYRGDVIVGAPHYDSTNPVTPVDVGAAYLYRSRLNEGWQVHNLIRGTDAYDRLGRAVGLGGMFWIAGEPFSNRNSAGTLVGTSVGRFHRGPYRTLSWYW